MTFWDCGLCSPTCPLLAAFSFTGGSGCGVADFWGSVAVGIVSGVLHANTSQVRVSGVVVFSGRRRF